MEHATLVPAAADRDAPDSCDPASHGADVHAGARVAALDAAGLDDADAPEMGALFWQEIMTRPTACPEA